MSAQTYLCKPDKKPYIKASEDIDFDIKQLYHSNIWSLKRTKNLKKFMATTIQ